MNMERSSTVKKPTNLSPDTALLREARFFGVNLSMAAEEELRRAVAAAKTKTWRRESADAITSSNGWAEALGLPLERYRQF